LPHTYQGPWVLSALLNDRAERFADKHFIVTRDESLTYAEVCARSAAVASGLRHLSADPAVPVSTMLEPTTSHLFTWFGCAWAAMVEAPINTEFKGLFLENAINIADAEMLVIEDKFLPRLAGIAHPSLKHVIVVGDGDIDLGPSVTVHRFADLLGLDPAPRADCVEEDLHCILYTSGTTGASRGAAHTHGSALRTPRMWHYMFETTPDDVGYSYLPMFHVAARSMIVGNALIAGASVVLRERFSASEFWPDVERYGATFFAYMGAIVQLLWNQRADGDEFPNTLRIGGGAAAPPDITPEFERYFGLQLVEVYGMTEIGTVTGVRPKQVRRGTVGKPFDHIILEVHDERDQPVEPGSTGEIVVRPRQPNTIMRGYWRDADSTLAASRNLWFHTGDLGKLTDDGYLVFVDRRKDSIRRRGENISSFEVERALALHPNVAECAVYPVPSALTEDEVMAAVVLQGAGSEIVPELFEYCSDNMPRSAVPRYLRVMAELPRTPTNRVEKYKLRADGVTADTADREQVVTSAVSTPESVR
jgi:carnitine-CoA ligase